jgi:hypothetical protein
VARADDGWLAARFSNAWFRLRRAIFCLRSRLNLDLSPFNADIMNSIHDLVALQAECHSLPNGVTTIGNFFRIGGEAILANRATSLVKTHSFECVSAAGNSLADCDLKKGSAVVAVTKDASRSLNREGAKWWRFFGVK